MPKFVPSVTILTLFLVAETSFSFGFKEGHVLFELGAYQGTQGKTQDIYIQGLLGDQYTVTKQHDSNALFGLGYFMDGLSSERWKLDYGINLFYLAPAKVTGNIIQEFTFTNLAYSYEVRHLPIYAATKATIQTRSDTLALTLDAGVGPNFMKTDRYYDWSLDGMTLPENAFSGHSKTTLSAMAGIGLKFTPVEGHAPLECGYRFFYLGKNSFEARTDQILNHLTTGNTYAQAVICTLTT